MSIENSVYPLSRYWYNGDFHYYYAYGNTPAQDFLQNITGEREPEILVLGCGDIRSCFYSLWKNFDVQGPARFDGVHFVLNDISAAVLARNILFLYLCLQMPKEKNAAKKWLCGMWAIWYCHELHQEHYDMLRGSLSKLCGYCSAWSSEDNPLYPLVKFTSSVTLTEINGIWNMWLNESPNVSKFEMNVRRFGLVMQGSKLNLDHFATAFVEGCTEIPNELNSKLDFRARKSDVLSYLQSGSVYAETVLGIDLSSSNDTFVNFTFYEREDGKYNLHYQSLPFSCYHQVVEFSKQQLQSSVSLNEAKLDRLLYVKDSYFTTQPFLANSVQQFCLWLRSAHKILCSKSNYKLSFTFDCSHALTFCYEMANSESTQKFDLIYSSNLMDHLGPPNLVLPAMPLLKEGGHLFTTTLRKASVSSWKKFLTISFGFDPKLFPLILGVRCINHEGEGYASPVTIKPCLLSFKGIGFVFKEDMLVWEKLEFDTIPLVLLGQPLTHTFAEALLCSAEVSSYPMLITPELSQMTRNLCVETAIQVILAFMSKSCADFNPAFWKPLSELLVKAIKPFLSSFQTQLLLHDIHMHLTFSEENCPICKSTPLSDSIGLFCAKYMLEKEIMNPRFMAFVHQEESDTAKELCEIARSNGDIHVFDCVSPSTGNEGFLQLYFYAPLVLVQKSYRVTVVAHVMESETAFYYNLKSLSTQPLSSMLTSFSSFKFFQAKAACANKVLLKSFGTITSHLSDGDISSVQLKLSQKVSVDMKLQTAKLSSKTLKLSFGRHACQLKFPYPVVYDSIKIKLKRSVKEMFLQSNRAPQRFEDEKPFLIFSPDKELSLSPLTLTKNVIQVFCSQQFTVDDRKDMVQNGTKSSLLMVKESLQECFLHDAKFIHFDHSVYGVSIIAIVNHRLLDYENRVPVIDLAYCFLESFGPFVIDGWKKVVQNSSVRTVKINDEEYQLLKTTFSYFASRTNGTCLVSDLSSRIDLLIKEGIQHFFTRAVISLLLFDADHTMDVLKSSVCDHCGMICSSTIECSSCDHVDKPDFVEDSSAPENVNKKCDYCGKYSHANKNCARCKNVAYCSNECQSKHWPEHSKSCTTSLKVKTQLQKDSSEARSVTSSQCSYCKKNSDELKKCLRCGAVQYCGKECQASHWPEHRNKCKGFYQLKMSQSSPETNVTSKSVQEMSCTSPSSFLPRCSYCKKSSNKLKKCLHCEAVQYCGKECQANHWPEHKDECKASSGLNSSSTAGATGSKSEQDVDHIMIGVSCAFCGMSSAELKFCGRCRMVKYCGEACQRKHWKQHKTTCKLV